MATQTSTTPKGWKMTTLGEVAKVNSSTIDRNYTFNEIEYIDVASVEERKLTETQKLKLENAPSRAKRIVADNSVLISTVRPNLKHYCFVKKAKPNLIASTGFAVVNSKEGKSDPYYLYNLLTTNEYTNYLIKIADSQTSTYPAFNPSIIQNSKFIFPPFHEQRAIAAVLSSLDDKIELLREQNKTLEATAQAIFKEWFVNFNFPNATGKMIDFELGQIPEGWKVGKLGDEFDITIGRTPPRLETEWFSDKPMGKKWISIKDIGNSEIYISNTSEYLTDEAIEKFNIPIIPENTTILSFKMTVGKLAITTEEMLSNEAIAHLKIKENSNFSTEFIYLFLKGLDFNSLGSTSSIVTAVNSTMIKALEVLVPEDQIMRKFNAVIQPIFGKLKNNSSQIKTLSRLRDTILPKLMNGKLRVKSKV